MPIGGPTNVGGSAQNNTFSLSIIPTTSLPAQTMVFILGISNVADSATITVTDQANNEYALHAFVQPPGSAISIIAALSFLTNPLSNTQSITIASDTRGAFGAMAVSYSGTMGLCSAIGTIWQNTTTPIMTLPRVLPGDVLLGMIAVNGPNTDAFTQDPNFSTAISVGSNQFAIHAGGVGPTANLLSSFSYAPVLGTLRQSVMWLAAFQ